ncbi:hypothetical protein CMI46_01035 [Candidatus Pacearchaeota archaeon]|nr:hypothetical protein [Candidatus Pacearchaeota archaeon]
MSASVDCDNKKMAEEEKKVETENTERKIMKVENAISEIRKGKERKFDESIELIVNLKKFDMKKTQINIFASIPHKIKDKKICGFIEVKNNIIDTIPKSQFPVYKDKKKVKKLVNKYDFFIASPGNMPGVASTFGRVLGPAGKMPSPKMGIVMQETEKEIKDLVEKINHVVRIQSKEPSIKISIGKLSMGEKEISENVKSVYQSILNELPLRKDNVKSVMIKSTMGKPVKVEME